MNAIDTEQLFYNYLNGDIKTLEFEKFIYDLNDADFDISPEDYFELISINYKNKFAFAEIEKVIAKYVDFSKFEKMRLINLLEKSKILDTNSGDVFIQFYNLYCDGYYFLQDLGLGYGLSCQVPEHSREITDDWDALNEKEKLEILSTFYPKVISDIERVQDWILTEKIILTGKGKDDRLQFLDYRSDEEKISTIFKVSKELKKQKKWWEFWRV